MRIVESPCNCTCTSCLNQPTERLSLILRVISSLMPDVLVTLASEIYALVLLYCGTTGWACGHCPPVMAANATSVSTRDTDHLWYMHCADRTLYCRAWGISPIDPWQEDGFIIVRFITIRFITIRFLHVRFFYVRLMAVIFTKKRTKKSTHRNVVSGHRI